ncbi:hypothetical protein [Prosthecobacter sp.]|uniref:hypothetical protein n=1 Tax=Prosthecobacter sp. TaxID=1965333 RepID=UPI0037840E39
MSESPASSAASQPLDTHSPPAPSTRAKEPASLTGLEKARAALLGAGLTFPQIPETLAVALKEKERWVFSTRDVKMSPYDIDNHVKESYDPPSPYVVLAHAGYGFNSYVITYYLVFGPLRLFLHLGFGGAYMNEKEDVIKIRECFSLADQIFEAAKTSGKLFPDEYLTVVCSDFYANYWGLSLPERSRLSNESQESPEEFLAKILKWLKNPKPRRPRCTPVRKQVVVR